jgi:hypothetical protein
MVITISDYSHKKWEIKNIYGLNKLNAQTKKKLCFFAIFGLDIVAGHDIHSFMDGCNMYN